MNAAFFCSGNRANGKLVDLCQRLALRVNMLPDIRSQTLLKDALLWASKNPDAIQYSVGDRDQIKQICPNIIGFQFVMHGIEKRILKRGKRALKIDVEARTIVVLASLLCSRFQYRFKL